MTITETVQTGCVLVPPKLGLPLAGRGGAAHDDGCMFVCSS